MAAVYLQRLGSIYLFELLCIIGVSRVCVCEMQGRDWDFLLAACRLCVLNRTAGHCNIRLTKQAMESGRLFIPRTFSIAL